MRVSGDGWVLANTNVSGYFRVNYDLDNWNRLISLLNTNHKVRHVHTHLSKVGMGLSKFKCKIVHSSLKVDAESERRMD